MTIRVTRIHPGIWGVYGLSDDSHIGDLVLRNGALEFQEAVQGRPPSPEETKAVNKLSVEDLP